ncbi:MAG TPA: M20/M25/M40 family metallo-hydrolase [Candidatus Cloacimonadota bacterium]|nr:M20/M25/M40 family metallo-hydrolase [Candidatus Cloacimonadota bacterium]
MQTDISKYFIELVSIDSESRDERAIADKLIADLKELGAEVTEDDSTGFSKGNTGNILARFPGKVDKAPILFCSHIDTVVPGKGIKPRIEDGKIYSDGSTVLGADDKSGVAQIMQGIKTLKDSGIDHAPIEVLFTVCEEIGLLGSKSFDKSQLKSAFGYAFDTQNVGDLILGAPSQNSFVITIYGKEAHAGVEPEKGINAIRVASEAIAAMPLGRIDFETTSNLGVIKGGMATNIVPNKVEIRGEARSHNPQKLDRVCLDIRKAVEDAVSRHQGDLVKAGFSFDLENEYKSFRVSEDAEPVILAKSALSRLGIEARTAVGGGGSDANNIGAAGIPTIICGTGMMRYHTVNEFIAIKDLEAGAAFVTELLKLYANS